MKLLRITLLIALLSAPFSSLIAVARAQEGEQTPAATAVPQETPQTPAPPLVHVVQDGENLTSIALLYGVSVQDLMLVNGLGEEDLIFPGNELRIPGAEGEAVAAAYTVQAGDSLAAIAASFHTTVAAVAAANRLVHPHSIYAGQNLALISQTGSASSQPITGALHVVQPGETLLGLAARHRLAPAVIAEANDLAAPARLYPGMRLRLPGDEPFQFLPGAWRTLRLDPAPLMQGQTMSVYVEHALPGAPGGEFAGQALQFAPYEDGFVALVGVDAFTEPGRYELRLEGAGQEPWWPLAQRLEISSTNFPTQTIQVSEELAPLLAPEVRAEEDAFLSGFYREFTPEPMWDDLFQSPVTGTVVTAGYGGARSYNGGPFDIFHTGVDFAGTVGTPIVAPAPGAVVYSGTLQLRGGTLILDHGLGVHSGYYHLSEIVVEVGQRVEVGQIIAYGGSSGLSTGPHLHWELRVLDVPVNALQWTERRFP